MDALILIDFILFDVALNRKQIDPFDLNLFIPTAYEILIITSHFSHAIFLHIVAESRACNTVYLECIVVIRLFLIEVAAP